MRSRSEKKEKRNRGFTLVELVIVIAILAILTGLLAPQYTKYVERTRMTADAENLNEMVKAFQVAAADLEGGVSGAVYNIDMTTTETIFWCDGTEINTIDDTGNGKLYADMCETLGESWLSTCLKSDNWQDAAELSAIHATITVDSEGSISVDYNPAQLKQITAKLKDEE